MNRQPSNPGSRTEKAPGVPGLILASGTSTRFGGQSKLAAYLGDQTVFARTLAAYCAALDQTYVVVRPDDLLVAQEAGTNTVELVLNPDYGAGQSSSLRRGLQALSTDAVAAVIGVADQPLLLASTITALVHSWRSDPVDAIVPTYQGERGNPVLAGAILFPELLDVRGDRGGRDVLRRHHVRELAIDEWWTGMDVDTPADLECAHHYLRAPPHSPVRTRIIASGAGGHRPPAAVGSNREVEHDNRSRSR